MLSRQESCEISCVRTRSGRSTFLSRPFRQLFDLLAITNKTGQRKKAAAADSSDLVISCPHSGQSSQLSLDHNHRSAQFLPTLARSALKLPVTRSCEHALKSATS